MFKSKYYKSNHTRLTLMNPAMNNYTETISNAISPPFKEICIFMQYFVSAAYVYTPTELKH